MKNSFYLVAKKIPLIAGGVMAISILCYLYVAFIYYPSLWNGGVPSMVAVSEIFIRVSLSIILGWLLASYNYRHLGKRKQGAFLRFIQKSWCSILLIFAAFAIYYIGGLHNEYNNARLYVWNFFVNGNVLPEDAAYLHYGSALVHLPLFITESFMMEFSQFSFALAFLAYQLRASFSEPSEFGRTDAPSTSQQ